MPDFLSVARDICSPTVQRPLRSRERAALDMAVAELRRQRDKAPAFIDETLRRIRAIIPDID